MASILGFIKRNYSIIYPPSTPPKLGSDTPSLHIIEGGNVKPLKFGILGAASIAPAALLLPALSHPEVVVYAVAARPVSMEKARKFAKKWEIEKVYEGYQALLDDPEVDVVYNPLPNMLHFEWTMKALKAGKHVLNEKPSADTADETRQMFELAEEKGLVLLDAYHYRFHPALKRYKEIVDSGELGKMKNITVEMYVPKAALADDDIRFEYALGGGALMDMGCYTVNVIRYLSSSEPLSVVAATHLGFRPRSAPADFIPNVDRRTEAILALPNDVSATLRCDLGVPLRFGFIPIIPTFRVTVEGEVGSAEMYNFVLPALYHSITVRIRGGHTREEKVYKPKEGMKGEEWWLTHRYQLEGIVDRIRGRTPETWVTKEDSVETMEWVERIYAKGGLGSRPKSSYVP